MLFPYRNQRFYFFNLVDQLHKHPSTHWDAMRMEAGLTPILRKYTSPECLSYLFSFLASCLLFLLFLVIYFQQVANSVDSKFKRHKKVYSGQSCYLESLTSLQNQFRVSISYLFFQRYFIQIIYIIYKQKYKYSLLLQTTNGITVLIVYDSIQSSISFEPHLFHIISSLLHCSRSLEHLFLFYYSFIISLYEHIIMYLILC